MSGQATRGLLDTSVFVAREVERPFDEKLLPEQLAISPVTVAELHVGVLATMDLDIRARRLATLESLADIEVLVVDEAVAASWALLRVHLATAERRLNVNDLWIAATALAHRIPVVTQDDDFGPVEGVGGLGSCGSNSREWNGPTTTTVPCSPLLRGGADQDLVDVDVRGLGNRVDDASGDVLGLQRIGGAVLEERGVGHAGLDQRDANAAAVQILARGLAHRRHRVLGARVQRPRQHAPAGDARCQQQMPAASFSAGIVARSVNAAP